ncbi:hypothetical protein QFC22_000228 [Naganishia vaughanmartiniae]|uniref:Uncharacterized protein n=1 Tax=Naganishia vaughanmartiniae TaxID=1424756 RepID=A0ACC2XMR0_9TREE|nr:hypothetical protein QFC22_000228 [Naganishia vaughanmartiniae]
MEDPPRRLAETTRTARTDNDNVLTAIVPPHRHVHYTTNQAEDIDDLQQKQAITRIGKDGLSPVPSFKPENMINNGDTPNSYNLDGDVADFETRLPPPSIHARRNRQQKRSMTFPDEYMNGRTNRTGLETTLDPAQGINSGLGFGFASSRRGSLRLQTGSVVANNILSSPSSDDEDSFHSGPNLSFRKERTHVAVTSPLAMAGPSRYPGMLQLSLPQQLQGEYREVSPRTVQRRRMASTGGGRSPDISPAGNTVPTPRGIATSPLSTTPPVGALPRLQAIGQQERPRRLSIQSLSAGKHDRTASKLRRISTDDYVSAGGHRRKSSSHWVLHDSLPFMAGSGESTTSMTTPIPSRPPSRHRRDSTMSAVHPTNASSSKPTTNKQQQRPQQGSRASEDHHSSTHGPSGDESMNEEKQDIAKTVGRKRKQSEDLQAAQADRLRQQQRSMSTPVMMSAVPEFAEYGINGDGNGNSNNSNGLFVLESREKTRRRPWRGMEDMGLESALEAVQKPQNDAASSAVLENLLHSIDLANAMRLIQKQTVIPSEVHEDDNDPASSPTVRVSRNVGKFRNMTAGNGKMAEIFVPHAPPPILYSPEQQDGSAGLQRKAEQHRALATGGGGHVAFTHPGVEVSSSEDAHSVLSGGQTLHHLPLPTQGRASRLSTSSSIPSGLLGSRRHVSTPSSLVSGNHKAIESGTTKNQPFMATGTTGAIPEPNNKHKRSISERFGLNRHLLGHVKRGKVGAPVGRSAAGEFEVDEEAAWEAKDIAKFQERIQSSLLELSHHPRAEKLAYQARSYLQGYYSNVFASIRDRELDPDPIYVFDPLAVIRWRKAVREEEALRVAYETTRTSAKAFSPGSGTASFDPRVRTPSKSANSPDMSNGNGQPASRPLHSAELLNRVDQSDTAKHLKVSPALREWVVTPSEIVAYLNCKGVVDHFVPSSEFEHPVWGEMPRIDRSPSTMTASSTHSRSLTSPSSRMWQMKATSNLQHRPPSSAHGPEGAEGALHGRKDSLETSDRFASVIKSPLQRIRRHMHPHHDRENYPQSAAASDTENDGIKGSRRHALLYTAQRFKIGQSTKEQVQHVETAPTMSHESIPRPQSSTTELPPPQKVDLKVDTLHTSGRQSPLAPPAPTTSQADEFDVLPVEVDEAEYRKKLRTLQSVENAMNRTPVAEREGQALVKDFITTVESFRARHGCSILENDLRKMRRVQLGYVGLSRMPQANGHAKSNGAATEKSANAEQNESSKEPAEISQVSAFNPMNAVKEVIEDLHERYNVAIQQAVEVCQQQDTVQRHVSELLPEAETLLSKIGDQVRKVSMNEGFPTD